MGDTAPGSVEALLRENEALARENALFRQRLDALEALQEKQKITEEENNKNKRMVRALSEGAEDAIFIIDREDRVDYVNSYAARLFGHTPGEIVGRSRISLFPPAIAEPQKVFLDRVFTTCSPSRSESCIQYPHNKVWMDHFLVPLKNDHGDVYAVLGISRDISARKKAEEQIQSALIEKEILLKEIHHRVKNNLQAVASLLSLQASQFRDPALKEAITQVKTRIKSMALVHEKLYSSKDFAYIDFGDYIRLLVQELVVAYGSEKTIINLEADKVNVVLEKAVPLSLILNELVSNAIMHGFPDTHTGTIHIELKSPGGNKILLKVHDNGRGLPETVDINNSPTLGLTLINALVRQIDGSITLEREEGTTFTVEFS
jgi:two-component system, sensor histidine kinase PdtaS